MNHIALLLRGRRHRNCGDSGSWIVLALLIVKGIGLLAILYLLLCRVCQLHTLSKIDESSAAFYKALEDKDFAKSHRILACQAEYIDEETFNLLEDIKTWNKRCDWEQERKPE